MNQGNGQLNQGFDAFGDPMAQFNQLNPQTQNIPVNGANAVNGNQFNTQMGQVNAINQMNPMNGVNQANQLNQLNQMTQMNQMMQMNQINPSGQMNFNNSQPSSSTQLNQMDQMNQMSTQVNNQMNELNQVNQPSPQPPNAGGETRGWNPAYVQSLLRKIQPGPGVTKQQRFQQLLKSGELTRTDVQILQRHQQMLRQAQSVRQKQVQQRAIQQQQQQQQQHASVAGKSVPGKSVPGKTLPGPNMGYQHSPVAGKSIPGKSVPQQLSANPSMSSTPLPMPVNLPVNSASSSQVNLTIASNSPATSFHSPMNQSVNTSTNIHINQQVNNSTSSINSTTNFPVNAAVNYPVNAALNAPVNANVKNLTPEQLQQLKIQEQKRQQQQQQLHQQRQQQKYFGVTPEQYEKLNPQQRQMLKMQYLRKKAKAQRFYESDEELLKKYENNPPSMDFHIHEDYYKFGHSDSMITKSNPAIKDFLKCVATKRIPEALMEIIKDGNIPMYDGNIILRVYDHRSKNVNSASTRDESEKNINTSTKSSANISSTVDTLNSNPNGLIDASSNQTTNDQVTSNSTNKKKFKEYRTILRMTPSALYEDFCVATDTKMFGDSFVLTYESEILTASTRSVNLQPINNPYLQDKLLWPELEMVRPKYDSQSDTVEFLHRTDMRELVGEKSLKSKKSFRNSGLSKSFAYEKKENSQDIKKRSLNYENFVYKPLHQDESQSNSKYEKLMLIMSQTLPHSNIASNKQPVEVPRFDRLRFIETLRQQKLLKKENSLRGVTGAQNPPLGYPGFGTIVNSMNSKPFIGGDQGVRGMGGTGFGTIQGGNINGGNSGNVAGGDNEIDTGDDGKGKNVKGKGKPTPAKKKAEKPKKPRKPTKKQLAAQAAAEASVVSTPEASEPPKKKRAPAKKKVATPSNTTN